MSTAEEVRAKKAATPQTPTKAKSKPKAQAVEDKQDGLLKVHKDRDLSLQSPLDPQAPAILVQVPNTPSTPDPTDNLPTSFSEPIRTPSPVLEASSVNLASTANTVSSTEQ